MFPVSAHHQVGLQTATKQSTELSAATVEANANAKKLQIQVGAVAYY
jgi:hypothetical protein